MRYMKGAVIAGKGKMAIKDNCPVPSVDEIVPTGALIKPLVWSPCTSDAHLCETGCESLPYLIGKPVGHEMCGEVVAVGPDVHDFKLHGMDSIPEAMQLFLDHDRSLIKPVIYNE